MGHRSLRVLWKPRSRWFDPDVRVPRKTCFGCTCRCVGSPQSRVAHVLTAQRCQCQVI